MALKALRCPCCGSNIVLEKDKRIYTCSSCNTSLEYEDGVIRIDKAIHYYDEAEIAKQQVIKERIAAKEREDIRDRKETKWYFIAMGGLAALCLLIALFTGGFTKIKAPVDSAFDLRHKDKEYVVSTMRDAGFTNIETIPVYDLGFKDNDWINKVSNVTIAGDDTWTTGVLIKNQKTYDKNAPVKIYYRLEDPEAIIAAPEGSSGAYKGKSYNTVKKKLKDAGFTNINLCPLNDLDSANDWNEMVDYVTIDGETDWTDGIILTTRKKYKRNVEVNVFYHSVK